MIVSSNATLRVGPIANRILQMLDRQKIRVWRMSVGNLPDGITALQARKSVHLLAEAGLLERIERGTYLVAPRAGRVLVSPVELVGDWFEPEPYAIVGHAAAEAHRLILDTSTVVEVQVGRSKAPVDFQGIHYVFPQAQMDSLRADNVTIKSGQTSTSVASPGKIVVLLLNLASARRSERPTRDARLALEVLERGQGANVWEKTDWVRLVRRHGNSAVARRLGFLLEQTGVHGAAALQPLRGKSGNQPFSPLYPATGPVDTRWRMILNEPLVR